MAWTALIPTHGHRAKTFRQHVLGDADDNETAVVTIPALDANSGSHIIIDEILVGYDGTAASKVVTVAQGSFSETYAVTSGAVTVENNKALLSEKASYLAGTTAVTVTLDASGAGDTTGAVIVKFRYENQD